ncbi:MAG TPA: DMT family transporter [Acidimicrobiales bacterium]|nr:DMT family transporter [Acidimicrobiales bacterium]
MTALMRALSSLSMAVVLALLAGLCNAIGTVMQRIAVESAAAAGQISGVLKRPVWFLGLVFMTGTFVLQALALNLGALSVVQPIQVTELVFLLAILGGWFRRVLGWREWFGAVGTAVGLGTFLAVGAPSGGGLQPDLDSWVLVLCASIGALFIALLAGTRGTPSWRAAWLGTAAGVAFAVDASLIKASATLLHAGGYAHLLTHWQPYGVAVAGLAGLVIVQHALNAGPIAASQSALLIVNPVASIVIGLMLFGDHLQTSKGRIAVDVMSLCLMFASLFVLTHSPLIASQGADEKLSAGRPAQSPSVRAGTATQG